jgi:hypothetical protein
LYFYDDVLWCERIIETIEVTLAALPAECINLSAQIHVFRHVQEAVDRIIVLREASEGRVLPEDQRKQVRDGFGLGGGGCQYQWCVYWQGPNWNVWTETDMRGFVAAHTFALCQAEMVWPNRVDQIPTSFLNGADDLFTAQLLEQEWGLDFQGSWNKSDCPGGSMTLREADQSYNTACAVIMGMVAVNQLVHYRGWETYFDTLRCMKAARTFASCFNFIYGITLSQFYDGVPVSSSATPTPIPIFTSMP